MAARRWCCGRDRSRRSRRSSSSPTRPRPRSCPRAATPGSSAARSPFDGEVVLALTRLDRIREVDVGVEHHDLRSGRGAGEGAAGRRRCRPPVSALAGRGGQLHHRRQSLHQCRWHRRARLWRRPRSRGRRRSRAGGRARAAPSQQAQEGQHRLRPQEPLHRCRRHARRHHRRGAEAVSRAQDRRDRVRRRCRRRTRPSRSSISCRSAPTAPQPASS